MVFPCVFIAFYKNIFNKNKKNIKKQMWYCGFENERVQLRIVNLLDY